MEGFGFNRPDDFAPDDFSTIWTWVKFVEKELGYEHPLYDYMMKLSDLHGPHTIIDDMDSENFLTHLVCIAVGNGFDRDRFLFWDQFK